MKKLLTTLLVLGCATGLVACKTETKKVSLEVPTELVVEDQYITFNEVENASYYNIYYDGNTWRVNPSYTGEVVIDASKIFTEIKTYEIKVKAIGSGKYLDSKYSEPVYYERTEVLGIPSIRLNQETLTWSTVENAKNYTIKVTFPDNTFEEFTYASNTYDIRAILEAVGTYSFQVKAGDSDYSAIATYTYSKKFTTPSNLSIEYDKVEDEIYLYFLVDKEITYFADNQIMSYIINVNDVNYELTDSLFEEYGSKIDGFDNYIKVNLLSFLRSQSSSFEILKDLTVSVSSNAPVYSNYTNSDVSNKIYFSLTNLLSAPVVRLSSANGQTIINWDKVNNATGYAVYIDYEYYTSLEPNKNSLLFDTSYLENKVVTIQTIGVDGKLSSPMSNPVYLSGLNTIENEMFTVSNNVLSFDNTCDKYFIEIFNENTYKKIVVKDDFLDLDLKDHIDYGKYTLKVSCYKVGYNPKVTASLLDYKKQLSTVTINRLGASNSMYSLYVNEVEDAIGYAVKINDKIVPILFTGTTINLTKQISPVGSYKIQVKAVADPTKNIYSSEWSEPETIQHRQQLDKPDISVSYKNKEYILYFPEVEGALNYTILVNYIPYTSEPVVYSADGYSLTTFLTTAQEYTVLVKANATPDSVYYTDSDFASVPVRKYTQLDVINADNMMINNQDGKYWLNFTTQTFAASYKVRIFHLEDEKEELVNIKTVPYDITNYILESGTYKIYITALADTENAYFYQSSDESGNPFVLEKDKPTLGLISGFEVGEKESGVDNVIATWDTLENADKYYLTVSYTNNYAKKPVTKLIDEFYSLSNNINLAQYLSKEGQYTIKIKGISDGVYESTSFAIFNYNYRMTVDSDFKRNEVKFNGNVVSHYVESYSQFTNLLQYYYLYNDINYFDENVNGNYKLKFMLAPNISIDTLNIQCAELNDGFTNEATTEDGTPVSDIARIKKLAETAINSYSEGVYFSSENPFGEPVYFNDNTTSYYIYNYETGLSNEKVTLEYKGSGLFKNTYSTIVSQKRRQNNYIYNLETKEKLDVTTTEQLFMVVQSGYAPNFTGNYTVAKTVFDNAKAILNTICTDEMTDYEKVVAIYTWLISNVNYNHHFDELMTTSNTLGSYTDASNTVRIGNVNCNYLESVFLKAENRIATSNGISKAFVLMCALEGIESVKVNGVKDGKHYYWNKVYLDCTPNNDENIKAWYAVDVSGSYQTATLQDNFGTVQLITYNIGSYQYFLVSDNYLVQKLGVEEKYNLKNAASVFDDTTEVKSVHNYYANTSYSYSKTLYVSTSTGLSKVTYSGSGILKYTDSAGSVEDYLKDVLSYLMCDAKSGHKYLIEVDVSASAANHGTLTNNISNTYYHEIREKFNKNCVIYATSLNNKILIAISCN